MVDRNRLVNWQVPGRSCFIKTFWKSAFSVARLYMHSYQCRDIIHSWQIPLSFNVKVKNGLRLFDLLTCWWCAFHCLSFIVNSLNLKWDQRKAHRKEEAPLGVLVKRWGTHDWGNLTLKSALQGLTGLSADWFDTYLCFFKGLKSMCAQRK